MMDGATSHNGTSNSVKLDLLYDLSGLFAGVLIILIAGVVLVQVGFNLWDSIAMVLWGERVGLLVPSYSEFTAIFFAGSVFMALPYAFKEAAHIRVELFIGKLPSESRLAIEPWLLSIGALMASFLAWSFWHLVLESLRFGDVSSGIVRIPLWLPQSVLFCGAFVFALSLWDYFIRSLYRCSFRTRILVLGFAVMTIALFVLSETNMFDIQNLLRTFFVESSVGWAGLFLGIAILVLLASGFWIGLSLMAGGMIGLMLFTSTMVSGNLASQSWGAVNSWSLAALPIFIWMGEILFRSRISEDLFEGLAPILERLPGRLAHVGILGSGIFAAISGSSAATAATIGKVTIPRLLERGYDEKLVIGVVAGSGTLGLLIPPSIILIVYGVATEQSIARLFLAGLLPGLLLVGLFMSYVAVWSLLNPSRTPARGDRTSYTDKLNAIARLLPVLLIIGSVLTVIYTGYASPTDAAAVGLFLSLVFALLSDWRNGTFRARTYLDSLLGAVRTGGMIGFIYLGAHFLTVAMGFTGVPRELSEAIGALGLSPGMLLFTLTLFFVVLGCFLDGVSIVLLTTAVLLPMVQSAGFDLIWFGIYLVVVVEMSQITPPVGFNLFVMQSLTKRDLIYVAGCALPFFLVMGVAVLLIYLVPEIATYLPDQMDRRP